MSQKELDTPQEAGEGAEAPSVGYDEILAQKGELESRVGELEGAMEEAQTTLKAQEDETSALRERLALAAAKYRSLLLASAPEVPEELVGGETVEEVEASFASARETVERVRRRLEAEMEREPRYIGAGAPPRTTPDLSGLSPREKIAYGLARR